MRKTLIPAAALTLVLAACGTPDNAATEGDDAAMGASDPASAEAPEQASATLMTADGKDVGTVTANTVADGVALTISLKGLGAGAHGAHIHDVGTCQPDFMASGPHWGPFDEELNLANDDTADDSANAKVEVADDGTANVEYVLTGGITLAQILDGDGSSFMIHAPESGSAIEPAQTNGDRIACGVFAAG